ncbi:MAG: sensory transduction histidine kinase [Bacteroidetes bacterium]|nr:sensory transduction histidine kinase [Bacteroidota bacterium]
MNKNSISPLVKNQTFSGINLLGNMIWGTHSCQFYQTKHDLLEILIPYFKAGLENNEFCLWIVSDPLDVRQATLALKKEVTNFDNYRVEHKIEILSHDEWYFERGKFNSKKIYNGWTKKLGQALKMGCSGMRVSGNIGWIEQGVHRSVLEYEKGLEQFLIGKCMIVLCTYPLKKCHASDVLDVAFIHDSAVSKRNGRWEIVEVPENKKTREQIQMMNDELERRVNERTMQLARAIEELKYEMAEHKKLEDELGFTYQHLSYHIENTPLAVIEFDKDLFVKRWSKLAEEMFGWKASEVLGINVYDPKFAIIYEEDIQGVGKINEQLMKGAVNRNISLNRNYTKDGKIIYCEWYNSVLRDERGNVITILSLVHNVTERKKAEEELRQLNIELRSLSSHLQNVREEERIQIARDIHDDLGQQLTALKIEVDQLQKKMPKDDLLKVKVNNILSLILEAINTIRRIAIDLRPAILDDLGLFAALDWMTKEFSKRTGILCLLQLEASQPEFEKDVTIAIFRIFQESLTNIAKHSKATTVTATIKMKNENLVMTICDNGIGFNEGEVKPKKSFGLLGMKERAIALNGEIKITSRKGNGTLVQLNLPMKDKL